MIGEKTFMGLSVANEVPTNYAADRLHYKTISYIMQAMSTDAKAPDEPTASPFDDMPDALFNDLLRGAYGVWKRTRPESMPGELPTFAMGFAAGMIAAREHAQHPRSDVRTAKIPDEMFGTDRAELVEKAGVGACFNESDQEKGAMLSVGLNNHVFLLPPKDAQRLAVTIGGQAERMGAPAAEATLLLPVDDARYVRA
jgi:hypothetical protein